MMKNVFITAIGGDIGYGIIKALRAGQCDLYMIGCDIKKYNMSYGLVDEFFLSPAYSEEDGWIAFIIDIIKKKHIDYFWPVTEAEIKIVDQHKDLFADATVVINTSNILQIAMDKGLTARFLAENGLMTPKTWDVMEGCEKIYPIVVKERFGCGSHAVAVVNNESDLKKAFTELNDPIVQEYIGNDDEEYTLTIFSNRKITNHIAFKRQLGFGGMSRYVELVQDAELTKIAEKIAGIFDLYGSINVQMRKCSTNYFIIEINPRISSTIGFRLQLGFNDVSWWIDMFDGKDISPYVCPTEKVFGVRCVEEKIFYEKEG